MNDRYLRPMDAADKIDAAQQRYLQSGKGKAALRRYFESEKGKEALKRYLESTQGREAQQRYLSSIKGRNALKRAQSKYYYTKIKPMNELVRTYLKWQEENPSSTVEDFLNGQNSSSDR